MHEIRFKREMFTLCAERLVFIIEFAEMLRLWGTESTHCVLERQYQCYGTAVTF